MFLNLKNKKVIDAALNNHIKASQYPKTFREDTGSRISKESIGPQTNRNTHHQFHKKPTQHSTITNQNNIKKTKKSSQSLQNVSKTNLRHQKIANAYKKLKNYDITNKSKGSQQSLSTQKQKDHRSTKQFPKNINVNKKQTIKTFTNNYIMISQTNKPPKKPEQYHQKQSMNVTNQILYLLLSIFNQQTNTQQQQQQETIGLKLKTLPSRQFQVKASLQRNSSKVINKNHIKHSISQRIKSRNQNRQDQEKSDKLMNKFQRNVENIQSKIEQQLKFNQNQEEKYSLQLAKKVVHQIQKFTFVIYEKLISQTDCLLKKYEKNLEQVCKYTNQCQQKYLSLEKQMASMKSHTLNLQKYLSQMNSKNHFAAYFFNQISYYFDVDTFLRQTITSCYSQIDKNSNSSENQENDNNVKKGSFNFKKEIENNKFLEDQLHQKYKTTDLKRKKMICISI